MFTPIPDAEPERTSPVTATSPLPDPATAGDPLHLAQRRAAEETLEG